MALNGYCTVDELKSSPRLNIEDTDSLDNSALENIITAVSRWIDSRTETRFYTVEETRYYLADLDYFIEIDHLVSLTSLKTDPTGDGSFTYTWATTDYRLVPYNAVVVGKPYTGIEVTPLGSYRFPVYPTLTTSRSRIQVTGAFGYSAETPPAIKEACLLMCARVHGRMKKPFGISGSADLGTLEVITAVGKDDELQMMLNTIKRRVRQ